jgi:hypothetical protein
VIESSPQPARRLGHVIAFVWLALLTTLAALDHVAFTHAHPAGVKFADLADLTALQEKVAALQTQQAALNDVPALSQEAFAPVKRDLEERLRRLQQEVDATARADDVLLLQDRIKTLETRASRLKRSTPPVSGVATAPPGATPEKSALLQPPFAILGTETRGGERFLSVAPINADLQDRVRILRPGDVESHWRLESLESNSAEFNVDGQKQRIGFP